MVTKVKSAALFGIEAIEVDVEIDAAQGMPGETIVGLPDAVIKESRERIKSALKHSGFKYPLKHYTINLAPAEIQKEGPFFDVPIAVGILTATGQLRLPDGCLMAGELSLTGSIKPIRGAVSICHLAAKKGYRSVLIPYDNRLEARLISGIEVVPVRTLQDIYAFCQGTYEPEPLETIQTQNHSVADYDEVRGQYKAKRALEIAAAGNHNVLLIGPPGSGKTMLLKRLPGILPDLTLDEAIEVFKIRSICRKAIREDHFTLRPPFQAPHHSVSYVGLVGGGKSPLPGEISLAHKGILFLDEMPEFHRQVLEVLRQPMEDQSISISRANFSVEFPADFLFAAAMNPCPCGFYQDSQTYCKCQPLQIRKYWKRISGPILDRIDMILEVPRLVQQDFVPDAQHSHYTTAAMKQRVMRARQVQHERYGRQLTNARLTPGQLKTYVQPGKETLMYLAKAVERGKLTARSFDKTLKLARTIADLHEEEAVGHHHVMEALHYRKLPEDIF